MLATPITIEGNQQIDILEPEQTVRVEMKASTLKRLLEKRQVCANDFHCLDYYSKECIKRLCLQTCLRLLS